MNDAEHPMVSGPRGQGSPAREHDPDPASATVHPATGGGYEVTLLNRHGEKLPPPRLFSDIREVASFLTGHMPHTPR